MTRATLEPPAPASVLPRAVPARRRELAYLLLALLTLPIFLARLGTPALYDTEAFYGEIPREMLLRDDWVTPHLNLAPHFDKPPLLYWLVAATYRALGRDEFTTRLWSALPAWGMVLLTAALGHALFGWPVGLLAGVILATSAGNFIFSRQIMTDPLLLFLLTGALLGFVQGSRGRPLGFPAMYVALALATLTKGLLALILPALILGIYVACTDRLALIRRMRPLRGLVLFLAIAAPWHILAGIRNPGFLSYYFIREHFLRFFGTRFPPEETHSTVILIGFTLLWAFPWTGLVIQAVARGARQAGRGDQTARAYLLLATWALVVVAFFSISRSKLEYYTLPALPAMAVLLGKLWADSFGCGAEAPSRRAGALGLGVVALAGVAALAAIPAVAARFPGDFLPEVIRPTAITLGATVLALGIAAVLLRAGRDRLAFAALAGMALPLFALIHWGFGVYEPVMSSKAAAQAIVAAHRPDDLVVADEPLERAYGGGLTFYTGQPPLFLRNDALPGGARRIREPRDRFLDEAGLRALWGSKSRVLLVANLDRDLDATLAGSGARYLLGSGSFWVLVTNHP